MTDKYHWIIYSKSRNAIWGKPYSSLDLAKVELETQMKGLSPEMQQNLDWKVEVRRNQYKSDVEPTEEERQTQKKFVNF